MNYKVEQKSGVIPVGQVNAHLDEKSLIVRVGVPHKGGKLAFHAFNQKYPVMVSANAFWDADAGMFKLPEATDLTETDFAMDSAGFSAISNFQRKGRQAGMAGVFPWTYEQYIEFATSCGSSWWSQPDLCCEESVAANPEEVDYRVRVTATLLEGCLRILYEWQNQMARRGHSDREIANALKPPVPVLQGRTASDYLLSLELLIQVWERWTPWLAMPSLIGLGSVCRRDLRHPTQGLFAILAALEGRLPQGSFLHLFGVKGASLENLKMYDWIASTDSMGWDFGARKRAHQAGISNTMAHRSAEMTRWMTRASDRLKPAAGDQFRLNLVSPFH